MVDVADADDLTALAFQ
ncbi:hypothetical protein [Streptomyces sp. SudanB182_2057]